MANTFDYNGGVLPAPPMDIRPPSTTVPPLPKPSPLGAGGFDSLVTITPPQAAAKPAAPAPPTPAKPAASMPDFGDLVTTQAPTEGNQFVSGFVGGLVGQNATMGGNAIEGLGVLTGNQDLQDFGKQVQASGDSIQARNAAKVPSVANIRTDSFGNFITDAWNYAQYGAGAAIGTSVPSIVTGAVASVATGGPWGFLAGAVGPSYIQNFGDVYGSLRDDPDIQKRVQDGQLTPKGIAGAAAMAAVPIAALDAFGLEKVVGSSVFAEAKRDLVRRIARGVATGAIVEGSTEGLQQVISEWTQSLLGGQRDLATQAISVADNALIGALGGGLMGGAGGALPSGETTAQAPQQVRVNDPGGELHNQVVTVDPDQSGVNSDVAVRIILPDGNKHLIGKALLEPTTPAGVPQGATPGEAVLPEVQPEATPAAPGGVGPAPATGRFEQPITVSPDFADLVTTTAPAVPVAPETPEPIGAGVETAAPAEAAAPTAIPGATALSPAPAAGGTEPSPAPVESAAPAAPAAPVTVEAVSPTTGTKAEAPSFKEIAAALPRDQNGDLNAALLRQLINDIVGRPAAWNDLTDIQKNALAVAAATLAKGGTPVQQSTYDQALNDAVARIQGVAAHEGAVPQPTQQGVPPVRGAGDQGVPAVATRLPGVPQRSGPTTEPATLAGPPGREQGIQPGQLPVGNQAPAVTKPSGVRAPTQSSRQNANRGGVGARTAITTDNNLRAPSPRGERGRGAAPQASIPGTRAPTAVVPGQEVAAQNVGEAGRAGAVNAGAAPKTRVERGKGTVDAARKQIKKILRGNDDKSLIDRASELLSSGAAPDAETAVERAVLELTYNEATQEERDAYSAAVPGWDASIAPAVSQAGERGAVSQEASPARPQIAAVARGETPAGSRPNEGVIPPTGGITEGQKPGQKTQPNMVETPQAIAAPTEKPQSPKPKAETKTGTEQPGTRENPQTVETASDLRRAEKVVETNPSEAQKESGVYPKGHIKWQGIEITIENPKGSERAGVDKDGETWSMPSMPAAYGYIKRTEGKDGDQFDVFLGDAPQSDQVYVIDQLNLDTGKFDEHKGLLAFPNQETAVRAYEGAYSDGRGKDRIGAITTMSVDEFRQWLKTADLTKPAEQTADLKPKKETPPPAQEMASTTQGPRVKIAANEQAILERTLRAVIARVAGLDTQVSLEPVIFAEGAGDKAYQAAMALYAKAGGKIGQTAGGSFRGAFDGSALIRLATADPKFNPVGSAWHEAYHRVEAQLMTDAEFAKVSDPRAMAKLREYAARTLNKDPAAPEMQSLPDYEVRAIAFEGYVLTRESKALPAVLTMFFKKLARLAREVRSLLARRDYRNFEDIYAAVYEGTMAERQAIPEGMRDLTGAANTALPDEKTKTLGSVVQQQGPQARRAAIGGVSTQQLLDRLRVATDPMRVKIQDRVLPIRRVQEAIEKAIGKKLPIDLDVYVAEALYHGRAGEQLLDLRHQFFEPLIDKLRKAKISSDEMGDYLYARHAPERNAVIKSRDATNDSGSGMTNAEATRIVRAAETGRRKAAFKAIANDIDVLIKRTRARMVRDGLLDAETAKAWEDQYKFYVPLRGWESDPQADLPTVGRGFDVRGKESKTALGRRSKADNPLAYVIMQTEQAIIRGEKNRVAKTLLRFVRAFPNAENWSVVKAEVRRRLNPSTGLVEEYAIQPAFSHNENLFAVKEDGKTVWIEVKVPEMARALRGASQLGAYGWAIGGMMKLARIYSGLVTSYNPEFIVSNAARDVQTALVNLGDVNVRGTRRTVLKDFLTLRSIRGIIAAMRDPKSSNEYAKWFEEYRHAGGKISFRDFNDVEKIKKEIDGMVNRGKTRDAVKTFLDAVEAANNAVENGVRLSAYIAMRKAGVSQDRAAFVARELTVNFNRKGELSPLINAAYLFFNASAQGATRIVQAVAKSKTVRRTVLAMAVAGAVMDLLNSLLSGEDDNGQPAYDNIPDYIKERNLILMWPGSRQYLMIPMPYGYNVPVLAGQQMMAVLRGKREALQAAGTVGAATVDAFNPMGTAASVLQFFAPTFLDPLVQIAENKTFYGAPIYPTKFDDNKPDAELYFASTPEWAKQAAKTINEMTGGNVGKSGWVDMSPETIQLVTEFLGGGLGRFASNLEQTVETFSQGKAWRPEDTPFIRRLYGKAGEASLRRQFYDTWDQIDAARFEVRELAKSGDQAASERAQTRNERQLIAYGPFYGAVKQLGAISDTRTAISGSDLPAAEKRDRLNQLDDAEQRIMQQALSFWGEIQKQPEAVQ